MIEGLIEKSHRTFWEKAQEGSDHILLLILVLLSLIAAYYAYLGILTLSLGLSSLPTIITIQVFAGTIAELLLVMVSGGYFFKVINEIKKRT